MRALLRLFFGFRWGEIDSAAMAAAILERRRRAMEFDIDVDPEAA